MKTAGWAAAAPLSVALLLGARGASQGAIYYHLDEHGVHHFTNAPTKPGFRILPAFGLPRDVNLTTGPYAHLINRAAHAEGIDPDLVRAIIRVESNFNPQAVSRKGAQGLMQLMPGTAAQHAVGDVFDPAQNITGGVRYLRRLMGQFSGDLRLVLAGYNAGENAVTRFNGVPPYPETRQYVRKVLALYRGGTLGPPETPAGVSRRPRVVHQVVYPSDGPPAVFRTRDADGRILYTNVPR